MTEDAAYLTVNDVTFQTRQGVPLLSDISFALPKGAVLAIAGPNGAGKTTLLNLISGIEPLRQGRVQLGTRSLAEMTPEARARRIAVVSQQSVPNGRLSLRDYVALGQTPIWGKHSAKEHAADLARILAVTGLGALAGKSMARLSGGERQRGHIARALAQRPELLFLDEPTNHLDPDAKGKVLSLVATLGITVVMIVHDLVMIPEFATHLALMKDTEMTAFGTVAEVLTPHTVRETFGVDYLLLPHQERHIPALDIRKTTIPQAQEKTG